MMICEIEAQYVLYDLIYACISLYNEVGVGFL